MWEIPWSQFMPEAMAMAILSFRSRVSAANFLGSWMSPLRSPPSISSVTIMIGSNDAPRNSTTLGWYTFFITWISCLKSSFCSESSQSSLGTFTAHCLPRHWHLYTAPKAPPPR